MILKLTEKQYLEAKKRGWIKKGIDLAKYLPEKEAQALSLPGARGRATEDPEMRKEYWMVGAIAPCEIQIVN